MVRPPILLFMQNWDLNHCFKAFKLMFRYYNRLIKIEQSKDYVYDLLRSAFDEDKQLHSQNCLSWGKSVKQLNTIFN